MYVTQAYDDALQLILKKGVRRRNRTGIDTLSVFSIRSVYEIAEQFPLLTKRKLFPRSVFAELLWMLSGSTNNNDLVNYGANFWTPWVDISNVENLAFYERTGIPQGFLGPVYGFQLRHFGGSYFDVISGSPDRTKYGFDQINWLINEIKTNPSSRRLLVSMWNPCDFHLQRLPPCHYVFHVTIDDEGRMTLLLNQRSCDFPIGVPANIQFYSALCYMLAQQTGCKPYQFIHHTEDSHIYLNQIEQVEEYLSRSADESPVLNLRQANDIFSYQPSDFEILNYKPQPTIKIPVAV